VTILVRPAQPEDLERLVVLRTAAWPDVDVEVHRRALDSVLAAGHEGVALLAWSGDDGDDGDGGGGARSVGFAELERRAWVPGCAAGSAAVLAGIFVVPGERRTGVGRELVEAASQWAAAHGCRALVALTTESDEPLAGTLEAIGLDARTRLTVHRMDLPAHRAPLSLRQPAVPDVSASQPTQGGTPRPAAGSGVAWLVHGAVVLLGTWSFVNTDIWSTNPWRGAIAPVVDALVVVYVTGVLIARGYARRTRSQDRAGTLFTVDDGAPRRGHEDR
jgi:aminoglycoside 6'-N-acetyltransferase I